MSTLNPVVRVPNLPSGALVDNQGNATDDELTFRQGLISSLQQNFGNEGLVAPSQPNDAAPNDNITQIQNARIPDPITGLPNQYSCAPGTLIYNTTNDTLMVAILVAGVPTFKTVTVT